jgi:putative DNA methylase
VVVDAFATGTVRDVHPASILANLDAANVSAAAKTETRKRESALPVISLYRWWARRTCAVASALADAAAFTIGRDQLVVADPFAGGGVIALAALLKGHTVLAQELDPWAARNLATMATPGDPADLARLELHLGEAIAAVDTYRTKMADGSEARVSQTLRVAIATCPADGCGHELRLYPTALVSRTVRIDSRTKSKRTEAWFACPDGHLHLHRGVIHPCPTCRKQVRPDGRYTLKGFVKCSRCRGAHDVGDLLGAGVRWEPVLVQRTGENGFEVAEPTVDERDAASAETARRRLSAVPVGADTAVLRRAGFRDFADLYPARQLALLETLLSSIDSADVSAWAKAVGRSCVIGSAEFAGFASRWDANYLKPYETVASHRYNVTTLPAEIDPWGERGRGTVRRRLRAAARAAEWLQGQQAPRQVRTRTAPGPRRSLAEGLTVVTGSSTSIPTPDSSIDLILTDPPYHDDVQYADLASLFRAWDGQEVGRLTGDVTAVRNGGPQELERFQGALTDVFTECRRVVKSDGHLVLSFANREPQAWAALLDALQAAGWHAAGFDAVHAENETDHAKSGRRSCALDVLLDLVPHSVAVDAKHRPDREAATAEEAYCFAVGDYILRIGGLEEGWRTDFRRSVGDLAFIAPTRRRSA